MNKRFAMILVLGSAVFILFAQENTTIKSIENYNDWGWDSYVMQNGLITTSTVPAIGARVMQYDLSGHSSIYINPNLLGMTYDPVSSFWPVFGGYKVWPAPQSKWPGSWPPPPTLDYGEYSAWITADTPDSTALSVESGVEQWNTPGLVLTRTLTMYKGTSRVKVDQTIKNTTAKAQQWSVWDVTQCIVNHPDERDFKNFWVYFPINPNSVFGSDGVSFSRTSSAWKGEVAPGIYGVQFTPDNSKIYADSPEGWICYVDERDSTVYVKTFPIYEGETYPDQGARVEVYNGSNPLYFEVEVLGPLVDMDANGGQTTFTEEWWSAKVHGPILDVNRAGAIGTSLTFHSDTNELTGEYGIFYLGTAQIFFLDKDGSVLGMGNPHDVSPLEMFHLTELVIIPENTENVEIRVRDTEEILVGTLDSANLSELTNVADGQTAAPIGFMLCQNYPNPFNPSTRIEYRIEKNARVLLRISDLLGKTVKVLIDGEKGPGSFYAVWNGKNMDDNPVPSGVYLYQIEVDHSAQSGKMVLMR